MTNETTAVKTIYFSIIANIALAMVKAIAGFFGNSYALIADAIESASDVVSSFLVLMGFEYARKPADKNHPYGHGKIEPLITFGVVLFLIISALIISYESIIHIQTPHKVPEPWTLIVLGLIIGWKEASYQIVIRKSKKTNSSSLRAEAWHHRSDALTSVMAFIGISIALILGEGYETADDWAALFAAAIILYNSYLILRPALGEVMDEQLYDELINDIIEKSQNVEGVLAIEKCFIRKYGMNFHADLQVVVDGEISVNAGHNIAHKLEAYLQQKIPNLKYVLIHIEPKDLKK